MVAVDMSAPKFFVVLLVIGVYLFALTLGGDSIDKCASVKGSLSGCRLRQSIFAKPLWNYYAGFYCYNYTDGERLWKKYNYTADYVVCQNHSVSVPVAIIDWDKGLTSFYDYTNETAMELIRLSFKTENLYQNFLQCCREAVDCCENYMDDENILYNSTHCPAVWDAWSCFPPTPANTTVYLTCSSQAYQSPDSVCRLESEKYCVWNEIDKTPVWIDKTHYESCAIAPVYERRHLFHVYFLAVCIIFCIPAIIIFLVFEKLRKTIRVALHRNLLISICVRNVLTIVAKVVVILDALKLKSETNRVMELNPVGCRILAFFEISSKNCIYACMLLDGFYLHKVIVRAFAKEISIAYMYAVLVALTFLPSLIWAITMGIKQADNCWMVDTDNMQWILDGVRILILVINTVLLIDIIRVMLLKLKKGSTTRQTKAALRATLFLIPLFGVHIVFTAKKIVVDDSCTAEDVYDYARYAMEALQGICVAILFCYANSEVHSEISNGYRKLNIYLQQKYGWKLRRQTMNRRRTTTATYVSQE